MIDKIYTIFQVLVWLFISFFTVQLIIMLSTGDSIETNDCVLLVVWFMWTNSIFYK